MITDQPYNGKHEAPIVGRIINMTTGPTPIAEHIEQERGVAVRL